uniref:Uncharacterized protein n=1 Tax=Thuretia quercifolia TaxID=189650 RepID=A0A1Z1MKW7_9FLOR|nr:hypothetical protein [Thuretia quercifolia]ARW66519.1 hypothetical protein [Thuretia quercifolia]
MKRRKFFINKINMLIISLKILNLYSMEYLDGYINNFTKHQKNFLNSTKYNLVKEKNIQFKFLNIIIYIYFLYIITKNKNIQKMVNNLIQDYALNEKDQAVKKYLNKFNYTYNKKYKYYSENHNNEMYINKVAIMNLYIISNINQKKNIFFFIKYLHSSRIN